MRHRRQLTPKDVRLLTDVRSRLLRELGALGRHEPRFFAHLPRSANAPIDPIHCNHDVPWTSCEICSKPRRKGSP